MPRHDTREPFATMHHTNPTIMSPRVMPGLLAASARCGFSLPDVLNSAGIRVQGDASHDGLPPNASVDGLLRLLDAARPVSLNACFPLALADSFRFEFFPEAETFLQSSRSLRAAKAAATKVEFFTLVRGEDK